MILKSPDPARRLVEEYKFSFSGGQILPVIIDKEAGDTVSFEKQPLAILISIVAKPSYFDPTVRTKAEEITIFYTHLLAIEKFEREVVDMTVEQREEWKEALKTFATPSPLRVQ